MTNPAASSAAGEHALGHVVPWQVLVGVFLLLMVLTVATVAATWVDLGNFNLWIAMGIATVKAAFVALYFMHLRYDHPFNALVFVTALLFLAIFLSLTLTDTLQYRPDVIDWREAHPTGK
jgi:cytochrome c oxidase subunit 4